MPYCKNCGEYIFKFEVNTHKCPPEYKIFHEDYLGDEPKILYANSHEEAATKYAEYYDYDDYGLIDGNNIEIIVESLDGKRKTFICSGRMERVYSAEEKQE